MGETKRQYFDRKRDVDRRTGKPVIHAQDRAKFSDVPWSEADRDITTEDFFYNSDGIHKLSTKHRRRPKRHSGRRYHAENERGQMKYSAEERRKYLRAFTLKEALEDALDGDAIFQYQIHKGVKAKEPLIEPERLGTFSDPAKIQNKEEDEAKSQHSYQPPKDIAKKEAVLGVTPSPSELEILRQEDRRNRSFRADAYGRNPKRNDRRSIY